MSAHPYLTERTQFATRTELERLQMFFGETKPIPRTSWDSNPESRLAHGIVKTADFASKLLITVYQLFVMASSV